MNLEDAMEENARLQELFAYLLAGMTKASYGTPPRMPNANPKASRRNPHPTRKKTMRKQNGFLTALIVAPAIILAILWITLFFIFCIGLS